jgi:hypothetical protein
LREPTPPSPEYHQQFSLKLREMLNSTRSSTTNNYYFRANDKSFEILAVTVVDEYRDVLEDEYVDACTYESACVGAWVGLELYKRGGVDLFDIENDLDVLAVCILVAELMYEIEVQIVDKTRLLARVLTYVNQQPERRFIFEYATGLHDRWQLPATTAKRVKTFL